ncbi:MAG: cell wall hydrolase [Caulobacteraceae bacterium]|nr:cell wall hydrolase [Caulobacteraceae bacterium]
MIARFRRWLDGRRAAALAAAGVVLACAATAGSMPRPDADLSVEGVMRATRGEIGADAFAAVSGRMDPAQLSLAARHDPLLLKAAAYGLTPGWETLTLAGKPTLVSGETGLRAQRLNAATPNVLGALSAARPFILRTTGEDRRRAVRCLTQAIYYEAALEPTEGQEAVAQVVLNRVRDPNYPNTVCGVVFQGAERITGCQFSFTCDGALSRAPAPWAWKRAEAVAVRALNGQVAARVGTATHYHADYVHPWWAPTLLKIDQIGAHIFYRWKGVYGETGAFTQAYAGREPVIDEARFAKSRVQVASLTEVGSDEELAAAAAAGVPAVRTVEIDGVTRTVGVASLGGRRLPTPEEVAAVNAGIAAFEAQAAPEKAVPPPGVTPMDVEEVGRPGD